MDVVDPSMTYVIYLLIINPKTKRRYGYLTSTQVKIIAVLNEGEPVREAELKGVG
jgi:hypothetical protein